MLSSIDRRYILWLTAKILRVCGVAGFVGFLLATAFDHLGANHSDIAKTTKISIPSISPSFVSFARRQDRLDQSRQRSAKADMLLDPIPDAESTHYPTQKQIDSVEIPTVSELNEPIHLAPWLEDEGMTLSQAAATEPVGLVKPELVDTRLIGLSTSHGFKTANSQQRIGEASTVGVADRAASGVGGKAAGALGL